MLLALVQGGGVMLLGVVLILMVLVVVVVGVLRVVPLGNRKNERQESTPHHRLPKHPQMLVQGQRYSYCCSCAVATTAVHVSQSRPSQHV